MDQRTMRNIFGQFATGVTVITCANDEGTPHGATVTAFTPISIEPRLCQVTLTRKSKACGYLDDAPFAVNLTHDLRSLSCSEFDVAARKRRRLSSAWLWSASLLRRLDARIASRRCRNRAGPLNFSWIAGLNKGTSRPSILSTREPILSRHGGTGVYIAASTHSFGSQPFAETCAQLVDLEYDKIELWLDEAEGPLRPSELAANPDKFVKDFREATRLTPVAFHCQEDPGTENFAGLCRLGKLLRVTQITLPAGVLGTPFNEEIDRLRERLSHSNMSGMRLSLKTQNGHLTEDPQTAAELCQAVPGLGLTLELSYFMCGRYANQDTDNLYPYVSHVHLRDTTSTQLQVPVGLGEIDYARIIAMLSRSRYQRALSVELIPELLTGLDRALELRKIRRLLETLL